MYAHTLSIKNSGAKNFSENILGGKCFSIILGEVMKYFAER